jgi:pimeloyl-ACP methyl ester carboxylesterase
LAKFTTKDGLTLSAECLGEGPLTLLFVHGFACDADDWRAQACVFAPQARVITLDLPGHGRSGAPRERTLGALARAVSEVKASWGGGRVVMIGHSLGCRAVMQAFSDAPEDIVGIVLIEQNLVAGGDAGQAIASARARLKEGGFHAFVEPAFAQMFTDESEPSMRKLALDRLRRMEPAFASDVFLSALEWEGECARQLSRVNVPVLLIHSRCLDENYQWRGLEPGMTTPWIELVKSQAPQAEVRVIPGAGHFVQIEAPAAVNAAIFDFIARLRSVRGAVHEAS